MSTRLARFVRRATASIATLGGLAALALASVTPHASAQADPPAPVGSIEDWTPELIPLPPAFAPDFPAGVEALRFPPGWRDPDSPEFWSYAFVLWIDEAAPSTERLAELLDGYYTGLMHAFGVGSRPGSPANEVAVELTTTDDGHHRGTVRLIDGFATFEPITVHLDVRTRATTEDRSTLAVRVSPRDPGDAIWPALQAAVDEMVAAQRIQRLAGLVGGEWRTGIANGSEQRDVWRWGPGRQSLTSVTTNSEGSTESIFGSLRVVYQHPRRDDLSVLVIDGPALMQTGRLLAFEDGALLFDMTLHYDRKAIEWASTSLRRISSVWSFDGPRRYTNSWVDDQGEPVAPGTVAWSYRKHDALTPPPPNASEHPERIAHFAALEPLLPSAWETDGTRTRFTWGRFHEAALMRTVDARSGTPLVETVFYAHPHTNVVHALILHASGAIEEGTVTVDGDVIRITGTRSDHRGDRPIERRIERHAEGPDDATLRISDWSLEGDEPTRLGETVHRAVDG